MLEALSFLLNHTKLFGTENWAISFPLLALFGNDLRSMRANPAL
ncbi:hypothetical protein TcasGA2_TC032407 [Tribolium castaneum]|uniref:Uncharacterized protein n=1 Tax=Tribolium castaneum TaxID=7070 RepID=A0A139WKU5_TRICA|nr:hypothetical protein TcasGA2_TC032407 [Tribolium castaneum]